MRRLRHGAGLAGAALALPLLPLLLLVLLLVARPAAAQSPDDLADAAAQAYAEGRVADSVAGFDRLAALVPSVAPLLWQRGIALYDLGRFADCTAQFLSYHLANPKDLESVAWHFLCTARAQSPARAKADLLTAGPDPRILRTEVYEMLRGDLSPADLVAAADTSFPVAQFYAHLYVGLYLEALGDREAAVQHLTEAASDRYSDQGGFMNAVAHVHLARLLQAMGRPAGQGPRVGQ